MGFKEQCLDKFNEFFPFAPEIPVDEVISILVSYLEEVYGDDILAIRHLGSTAESPQNKARSGYKPPHRGSDIDILVIVKDDMPTWKLYVDVSKTLSRHPISKEPIDIHFVNQMFYRNATLDGHPSLALFAHAKEFGRDVGSRKLDMG